MKPERLGHSHQIGQGSRGHFPHEVATVDLHGDLAHPDFSGDLLVHQPGGDQGHHLSLSGGQGAVQSAKI